MRGLAPMKLLLLASLASVSCSRGEKPVVQRSEVDVFEGREIVGWETPQLLARLDAALLRAGFTVLGDAPVPSGVKPWRIALAARIDEPDPQAEMPGSAVVALSFRQKGAAEGFEVEASEQTKADSNEIEAVQAAAVKALDLAIAEAAAEAKASIELDRLQDDALARRANDADVAVQAAATRLLARRHHPAALPALLKRLQTDDLGVLRRTVGMLVELKNPAAVPAIIEASRARNPVVQREIVFALSAIGGDEAEAYLDVVASGHDDPLLRASAEKALGELRDRVKRNAPSSPKGTTP
ncbi:MAG: HEAT repeat domain-containing protein [Myxococcales bacterium]|nr:HEAT repeat domain-containing protein [Myxococcales bacterium]